MSAARRWFDGLLLLGCLILIWQGLHELAGDVALTSPSVTVSHALTLLESQRFWPHAFETMRALAYALLIASLGGLGLGAWLGAHKLSGQVAEPVLIALYSIPKVTLYPLILLVFGLGISAKVAFGAIHGVIPVAIFTLNAVRAIKPVHFKTARALRLSPWQAFASIWLPAALPEILAGQRVGFSLTFLGVMIGEMFASQRGIGFLVMNAIGLNDVKQIMALVLMIAVVAVSVNGILLMLDRKLSPGR
jgi:NitT/TauT family transport system permease protein